MNNNERQAMIEFIKSELAFWTSEGQYHQVLRVALATLTAEPVKVPDELTMREAIRLKLSVDWAAGYNTAIAHCKELSDPIDNTAQQYEALAGWKMVPIEPTEEMLAAGDGFMDGLSELGNAYSAMVEAAPKLEGKR